jgi:hypothetical protein
MAGPVRRGGQSIHWAASPSRSNQSPATSSRLSSQSSEPIYFSPGDHRLVESSPLPVDGHSASVGNPPTDSHPRQDGALQYQSAPGMLGMQYDLPSAKTLERKFSYDQSGKRFKGKNNPPPTPKEPPTVTRKDDFHLDPMAPARAIRASGGKPVGSSSLEKVEERAEEPDGDVQEATSYQQEEKGEDSWGDCFAVEWISTRKLSFSRTRQIRNPWNHDREVKVSRDGTELEPTVGQKLLDEWHKLSEPQEKEPLTFEADGVGQARDGSKVDGVSQARGGSKVDGHGPSSKRLMRPRSAGEGEKVV